MIIVVDRHNSREHGQLVRDMFRLRARIFGDRLRWNVHVIDGMERDRFDDENPLYVIDADAAGIVQGSLRLLPTTGPTLFREVFAATTADAAALCSPTIWECTRFCVNDDGAPDAAAEHFARTSGALIAALGELGL